MSAVTVREVLALPALRRSTVVAGSSGVDRLVSGVNVMEVPDIESFVEAGEILLTTAYPLREHPDQLDKLVRTLARRGLAALAVKPGRYLDDLPRGMLDAADELAFPLIVLAADTSFNEIIGAVLATVLSDDSIEAIGAESIRERLTGVALSGGGLNEIARTLSGALDRLVEITDTTQTVEAQENDALPEPRDPSWTFPVRVAGIERARLIVHRGPEPTLEQRRLIRQACFAAGMHIAQAFASVELDRQMRVLYLEELVSGRTTDEGLLMQRARLFGWDLTGGRAVVIAQCDTELADARLNSAKAVLRGGEVWSRGREAVAIVSAGPELSDMAAAWRSALVGAVGGEVVVAAGTSAMSIGDLAASHTAAREALTIAVATGQTVGLHDHLTLERAILAIPRDRLTELVDDALGPLLAVDRSADSELCETLETYLATGNAAESARRLFIHYNTMKHRMGRITELLGDRIDRPQARLALAFALQARKFLVSDQRAAPRGGPN